MSHRVSESGRLGSVLHLLAAGIVLGVVSGWLWFYLWDAPDGVAFQGNFYLDPPGPDVAFSGTALYVLLAGVFGVAFGVGAALLVSRPLRTTLATLVVSGLAGAVMFWVGHALGPGDPHAAAKSATDYDPVPAELAFTTDADQRDWMSTAIVSWPAGAMAGLAAIYLALPGPPRRRSATDRSDGGVGEVTQVIG